MNPLRKTLSGIFASITLALAKTSTGMAQGMSAGAQAAHGTGQPTELFTDGAVLTDIVNTMLFLVGAVAVIMIIYGGFRYVTSGGNASHVTAAKNTILYAIVGVIVALLAYAVVDFVVEGITGTGGGNTSGL